MTNDIRRAASKPAQDNMIVGITLILLLAVSVHVRRFVNAAAMFVVCAVVWVFMCVAMPLESPSRILAAGRARRPRLCADRRSRRLAN